MYIKIYLYFLLFFNLIIFSKNYIVIPFNSDKLKRKKDINKYPINQDIDFIIEKDKLFTLINLGNDKIELYLTNDFFYFFLGNGLCRNNSFSTYNPLNSKNYKNLTDYIHRVSYIVNASISSDNCLLFNNLELNNNIFLENVTFIYGVNTFTKEIINIEQICGFIGLQTESGENSFREYNFIKILKKNKIISSYTWSIIFFSNSTLKNYNIIDKNIINKYEGILLSGIEEKDIIKIFSTKDIRSTKAKPRYSVIDWGFIFSEVYFDNQNRTKKSNYQNKVHIVFNIDLDYIICTEYFFKHLLKTLFKEYLEQNICNINERLIQKGKYIIVCNKEFQKYINLFPDLYFYHKELNYTFVLKNSDLFEFFNNKIYFLMIHIVYYTDYWSLGNIFLKKYPFVFDYDKKMISYINIYSEENKNIEDNFERIKNKFKSFWNSIKNISIIIGIIIGILIGKKLWDKNRKKRANELIDSFVYESQLDNKKENKIKNLELKNKILYENN